MLPEPHGSKLIDLTLKGGAKERAEERALYLPRMELDEDSVSDVVNISTGVYSPLDGFMKEKAFKSVLQNKRLPDGLPWTTPVVLDTPEEKAREIKEEAALFYQGRPIALLKVEDKFIYDKEEYAKQVYGTTDPRHPGVAKLLSLSPWLLGGTLELISEPKSPFPHYTLSPKETRALFQAKGWKSVVGFQTRNVPHIGHEYVQKTALTFVDGLFINPVIGRKKKGDFKDDLIIKTYETLIDAYFPKDRVSMAVLRTEMRYAGPREAIFHAIVRKNFGCTHFIVGRDHAGVGNYYHPYAAHEIFQEFPDLGITPLFFTAFFFCKRCGGVTNEKVCPHPPGQQVNFSGTLLRELLSSRKVPTEGLIREEVARLIIDYPNPFVEE